MEEHRERKPVTLRPWSVLAISILWGCFFVAAHRRIGFSDYLRSLVGETSSRSSRLMHVKDGSSSFYQTSAAEVVTAETTNLLREAKYHLNDRTMRLSPYVPRPWLQYHNSIADLHSTEEGPLPMTMIAMPKRKLILTDYGWNHPDPKVGLIRFPRSLRIRELLQAFIDHSDFDPTFTWRDMMRGKAPIDTTLEYVVFMDIETCFESNYPYSVGEFDSNADTQQNRIVNDKMENPCFGISRCADYIQSILESPLFLAVNASTMLYFDCRGNGPDQQFRKIQKTHQITIVSLSSGPDTLLEEVDMGMPPPAPHPIQLSTAQRRAIATCESESSHYRPHFFTFLGRDRPGSPRNKLRKLHNGRDILLMDPTSFENEKELGNLVNETFESLLSHAVFSAAPRGDNRFSYRFTEVLSAGGIPVIHSDGWVLPLHKTLVNWTRCAVIIPEAELDRTVEILKQIDPVQRCAMRQYCYEIYRKYMVNPEANVAGILAGIASAQANSIPAR